MLWRNLIILLSGCVLAGPVWVLIPRDPVFRWLGAETRL